METLNTFGENIAIEQGKKYHLSIQVGNKALSYAILDIEQKKYLGVKEFKAGAEEELFKCTALTNIVESDSIFSHQFESISIMPCTFRAMLVPETLFDSKNLKSFLKFHHDVDEKDMIQFVPLKAAEAFVIFSMPKEIKEYLTSKFQSAKFSHHCAPFIHNALTYRDISEQAPCLHIHFAADFFDVLIVRNNKVQLFNSFFYKKYTDAIYFLVNLLNLFSLKPDHSKVYISGDIEEKSELKSELEKIFKPIAFEKYSLDYSYAAGLTNLPQHRFVNLLNLYSCGL